MCRVLWAPTSAPSSTTSSLKLPCPLPRDPWEGRRDSQTGRQNRACLCAHVCALRHTPSARQPPDPREAPAPVTWYQNYLGNWPFWFRVNWGVKPLGFVKKHTVREMLCHLVRQTFFLSSKIMMGFFFSWICFTNKPDWSISLLTACLFVVT